MRPLAAAMKGMPGRGSFRVTCLDGERGESWTVRHESGKAALAAARGRKPTPATCEVLASEATLRAILSGELSPLDALMQNRLRLRGDLEYGRVVLGHLAVRPNMRTEIC
jgi:putative sterol carrier protein